MIFKTKVNAICNYQEILFAIGQAINPTGFQESKELRVICINSNSTFGK